MTTHDDNLSVDEIEAMYGAALARVRDSSLTVAQQTDAVHNLMALGRLRRTVLVAGGNVRCLLRSGGNRCLLGEGHEAGCLFASDVVPSVEAIKAERAELHERVASMLGVDPASMPRSDMFAGNPAKWPLISLEQARFATTTREEFLANTARMFVHEMGASRFAPELTSPQWDTFDALRKAVGIAWPPIPHPEPKGEIELQKVKARLAALAGEVCTCPGDARGLDDEHLSDCPVAYAGAGS